MTDVKQLFGALIQVAPDEIEARKYFYERFPELRIQWIKGLIDLDQWVISFESENSKISSHHEELLKVSLSELEDIHEHYRTSIEDIKDHPQEDCDCDVVLHIEIDRDALSIDHYEVSGIQFLNKPYSTERTIVFNIMACPSSVMTEDELLERMNYNIDILVEDDFRHT